MSEGLETVGIVGAAGDLGSKLSSLVTANFDEVLAFDIKPKDARSGLIWLSDLGSILEESDVIHWCAPIDETSTIPRLAENQLLVLHDSVMANSHEASRKLKEAPEVVGSIAVVHLLMNVEKTVVVSAQADAKSRVTSHVKQLGLSPKPMEPVDHDTLMADTQAPLAILCHFLLPKLEAYDSQGLLTPSGHALKTALEDRSAKWTDATFMTILSNPELPAWLQDLLDELLVRQSEPAR